MSLPTSDGMASSWMTRFVAKDGTVRSEYYGMAGAGFRLHWNSKLSRKSLEPLPRYLSVEVDIRKTTGTQGIWGYLYGDGELLASTLMLHPGDAKRGYGAAPASFWDATMLAKLNRADRWSFVAIREDGSEIERFDLSVPDRLGRAQLHSRYQHGMEAAWDARVATKSIMSPGPLEQAPICAYSTPEDRWAQELSQI